MTWRRTPETRKELERAELAAGRNIARKRKAEELGRGRGYGKGDSSALQPVVRGQLQQPLAPPVVRPRQPSHASHVGEPGHMRRECPKRSTSTTVCILQIKFIACQGVVDFL